MIVAGQQFVYGVITNSKKIGVDDSHHNFYIFEYQNEKKFYFKCYKFQPVEWDKMDDSNVCKVMDSVVQNLRLQLEKSQNKSSKYIFDYQSIIMSYPYACFVHRPIQNVLSSLIKLKSLNYIQKINLLLQITKGLRSLHQQNIYLGNLSPSHVLILDQQNNLFEIQFCPLKILQNQVIKENITKPEKNYHIAPEIGIFNKHTKLTAEVDIWSLGLISYELLFDDLIGKINQNSKKPQVPKWAPSWISQFINKMISINPKERHPIKDIIRILENALICSNSTDKLFSSHLKK